MHSSLERSVNGNFHYLLKNYIVQSWLFEIGIPLSAFKKYVFCRNAKGTKQKPLTISPFCHFCLKFLLENDYWTLHWSTPGPTSFSINVLLHSVTGNFLTITRINSVIWHQERFTQSQGFEYVRACLWNRGLPTIDQACQRAKESFMLIEYMENHRAKISNSWRQYRPDSNSFLVSDNLERCSRISFLFEVRILLWVVCILFLKPYAPNRKCEH